MSKKVCLTLQTIPSVLQVTCLYNDFTQINFEAGAYALALGLFPSSSAILKGFLNPFMANLTGTASYSASYSVKMEGHIFHCVICHYSEMFLNSLSFKNERQSIRHYEVRTLF